MQSVSCSPNPPKSLVLAHSNAFGGSNCDFFTNPPRKVSALGSWVDRAGRDMHRLKISLPTTSTTLPSVDDLLSPIYSWWLATLASQRLVEVYTDGSATSGVASWAVCVPNFDLKVSGRLWGHQNNYCAELAAIFASLRVLPAFVPLVIHSDAAAATSAVCNCLHQGPPTL